MVVALQRVSHSLRERGVPLIPQLIFRMLRIVLSASLSPDATIGPRCVLGYGGLGIVIHGDVVIGPDCTISQGVTLGGRGGTGVMSTGVPTIGAGVLIGAGAVLLGPIEVGDGARIGANAVVLDDVSPGATAVGAPARVVTQSSRSDLV